MPVQWRQTFAAPMIKDANRSQYREIVHLVSTAAWKDYGPASEPGASSMACPKRLSRNMPHALLEVARHWGTRDFNVSSSPDAMIDVGQAQCRGRYLLLAGIDPGTASLEGPLPTFLGLAAIFCVANLF